MGNPIQQNCTLLPSLQVYCHLNYDSKARNIQHWKIVVVVEPTIETEITWISEPPAVDDYNLSTNQQLIKQYKLITGKWGKHLNCYQQYLQGQQHGRLLWWFLQSQVLTHSSQGHWFLVLSVVTLYLAQPHNCQVHSSWCTYLQGCYPVILWLAPAAVSNM